VGADPNGKLDFERFSEIMGNDRIGDAEIKKQKFYQD
jgi:hypothetical protein